MGKRIQEYRKQMANIIEITDFAAPELNIYARYSEVQLLRINEPNPGIFIAESPKVVERALDAGYEPISMLVEHKHIETQAKELIARCGNIPVYTAEYDVLTKLTGFALTRGMLCAMTRRTLPTVEEVCSNARQIAVLENVVNPTNVGAIFRSAAALNVDGILVSPTCCDPLYRRSARVSMGTVFQVPWTRIGSEARVWPHDGLSALHEAGFSCAAMALTDDSVSLDDPVLRKIDRLAIFMGTEGAGLGAKTIAGCDHAVRIPMAHGVDSLNVAAASAVAFWQLCPHVSNEYHYQPGLYH